MWKDVLYHQSLWNCKLKPQCDTTIHWVECLKLKGMTIPSVGDDVEELLYTVDGNIKWYNHSGK